MSDQDDETTDFEARMIDFGRTLQQAAIAFQENVAPRILAFVEAIQPAAATIEIYLQNGAKADLLEEAGWLPHPTSPLDSIHAGMTPAEAGAVAEAHYRQRWAHVQQTLTEMVALHDIDQEARETFAEALAAHGAQLYRVAPRLLLPEIERVVRQDLLGRPFGRTTSLKDMRSDVEDLPLRRVLPVGHAVALYKTLMEHLYEKISSDVDLTKMRSDPVPNRHAAIHGLVRYGTMQSSLNAIVMAEYLFGLAAELKRARNVQQPQAD